MQTLFLCYSEFMDQSFSLSCGEKKKLLNLGVEVVYLFGSYAENMQHPLSDVDFAVLMTDPRTVSPKRSTLELYQKLFDVLAPHVPAGTKDIDIVFLQRAPLELQDNVTRLGKVLFERDPETRLDFAARTMLRYADFASLRILFDQAILQRI